MFTDNPIAVNGTEMDKQQWQRKFEFIISGAGAVIEIGIQNQFEN